MTHLLAPAVVVLLAAQAPKTVAETVISAAPASEMLAPAPPTHEPTSPPAAESAVALGAPERGCEAQASGGRVLRVGDEIRIVVADQSEEMTLNPEGAVFIRGLGAVPLAGLAPDAAAADLASKIRAAGYPVAETDVAVFLIKAAQPPEVAKPLVFVTGAVRRPGEYPAASAGEALRAAGGLADRADTTTLIIEGRPPRRIDAAALIERRLDDVPIDSAATIVVEATPAPPPPPHPRDLTADSGVTVLGEVARPGIYTAGRLTAILASAGGTTDRAAWRLALRLPDGSTRRLDLYAVLRGREADTEIPAGAVLHALRSVNPLTILRDLLGIGAAVGRAAQ